MRLGPSPSQEMRLRYGRVHMTSLGPMFPGVRRLDLAPKRCRQGQEELVEALLRRPGPFREASAAP